MQHTLQTDWFGPYWLKPTSARQPNRLRIDPAVCIAAAAASSAICGNAPAAQVSEGAVLQPRKLGLVSGKTFSGPIISERKSTKRDRGRERAGNMGGRCPLSETYPEAVALAKKLAHGNRARRYSLREISAKLAEAGTPAAAVRRQSRYEDVAGPLGADSGERADGDHRA